MTKEIFVTRFEGEQAEKIKAALELDTFLCYKVKKDGSLELYTS